MIAKNNINFRLIIQSSIIDQIVFNTKFFIFLILVAPMILISFIFGRIFPFVRNSLPVLFYRMIVWLISIKIEYEGNIEKSKRCNLFVSNHISYLDIPILGSQFPLKFVAKSEVKNWPIFGFLSRLAGTIFIKRVKSESLLQKYKIFKLLSEREKILIFPEATSSDGNRVLSFKSNVFSAVENQNFFIQPLVIIYSEINGIPINRWLRPIIAWYGDMILTQHLLILKNLKSIQAKIIYLEPVNSKDFTNRKDLSKYIEQKIYRAYSLSLSRKKLAG
ncbi:MAG: lysophospholipid acyltransferase family protein [Proteobacteria bacterium]|nr:lysophospholipid acyltransferase family protein [Pseudomonadota bacterium]MDA1135456.1 lysophospholipid acyltransferase family protein [Pseudomonadota bacterium]